MGVAVGIDLGTTNTVVAAVRNGVATTLADGDGNKLIPSIVAFHPNGTVQVGWPALDRRIIDPENTIYSIKRLIGRSFTSPEVQGQKSRFPFTLVEGPKAATLVHTRAETYALPEISAFVLRRAKAIAEQALGETVDAAVITVPANFDDPQRASTKIAGKLAGLEVLRILNEPTAAALAYGRSRSGSERACVYDLGGGTFDVTLLDVANGVFEVLGTAGDTALGGDDVDQLIVDKMREMAMRTLRVDPRGDPTAVARMRVAAEKLKKDLSAATEATVVVEGIGRGEAGVPLKLTFALSRAELESLTQPLVSRTMDVTRAAMGQAKLDVDAFDRVILVGGATRMPIVVRHVQELFKKKTEQRINPDEVVALGAAIQAYALGTRKRVKKPEPRGEDEPPPTPRVQVPIAASSTMPPPEMSHAVTGAKTQAGVGPAAPRAAAGGTKAGVGIPPARAKGDGAARGGAPPTHSRSARPAVRRADVEEVRSKRFDPRAEPDDEEVDSAAPTRRFGDEDDEAPTAKRSAASPVPRAEPSDEPLTFPAQSRSLHWSSVPPALGGARRPSQEPSLPPVPSLPDQPRAPEPRAPEPRAPEPRASERVEAKPLVESTPHLGKGREKDFELRLEDLTAPSPELEAPSLLIDVTPLSLRVETVGGYSDVLIGANTAVPCDRTRVFSTASDGQTQVFIRVAQGERTAFKENTFLGELELSGLAPLPRGEAKIQVTFAIDADGILAVRARDGRTGHETTAKMHVFGAQTEDTELQAMMQRQAERAVV